jgi:hypothetical protein
MGHEERAGRGVVKLTTIVALDYLNGGAKLGACISEKIGQRLKRLRLETKRECPSIMSAVIQNDKIIFIPRCTKNNRRHPKITVNKIKRFRHTTGRQAERRAYVMT